MRSLEAGHIAGDTLTFLYSDRKRHMNQIQEQHAVLPTKQFDARLAEELKERVEFSFWSHTSGAITVKDGPITASGTIHG